LLADRLTSPLTDPGQIGRRLDGVSFLRDDTRLCEALRLVLRGAPDMPRSLSRLALGRGGPRDLGALAAGFDAATQLAGLFSDVALPDELQDARDRMAALPAPLARHLARVLADELPLLKRDGGFVRGGYDGELDEMRALRDES